MMDTTTAPAISVTGLRKDHAIRARKWLRARSLLSFYRREDKSLNMLPTKFGRDADYEALHSAVDATRKW